MVLNSAKNTYVRTLLNVACTRPQTWCFPRFRNCQRSGNRRLREKIRRLLFHPVSRFYTFLINLLSPTCGSSLQQNLLVQQRQCSATCNTPGLGQSDNCQRSTLWCVAIVALNQRREAQSLGVALVVFSQSREVNNYCKRMVNDAMRLNSMPSVGNASPEDQQLKTAAMK